MSLNVKEINEDDKPRERFKSIGGENLSETELLAIILQTGTKELSVVMLSQSLIEKYGCLFNLVSQSLEELMINKGIGNVKAIKIKTIYYVGIKLEKKQMKKTKITNAKDVFDYMSWVQMKEEENVYLLVLKNNNEIIKVKHLFKGNINSVMISPREIFKEALLLNSNKICLIHNHPSGDISPSMADVKSTEYILKVANLIDIKLLDHIIIAGNNYFSLKEKEILDFN